MPFIPTVALWGASELFLSPVRPTHTRAEGMTMSAEKATPLHPMQVVHKGHTIILTHRPKTNDWEYRVEHTRTITLSGAFPRYETALNRAKRDIDVLTR